MFSVNPGSGSSTDSTIMKKATFGDPNSRASKNTKTSSNNQENQTFITNHRTKNGANILHYAASISHDKGVLYTLISLAKNANLSHRDKYFLTPRDVASESMLSRNVFEIDQWVLRCAAEGKIDELKELLLDGYEYVTELEGQTGRSITDIAAINKQAHMVEFLHLASAFEERKDFLHKVIKVGSLPHVEFLADSEDIVRAKDNKGRTSLHLATLCEEGPIMLLLAKKFPFLLSIGDNLERTPLHYAMAVENVVQAGAKRTARDLRNKLPSFYFMNREEIVSMSKEIYREDVENDF